MADVHRPENIWDDRTGGGSSHERTGLRGRIAAIREKYREICRISVIKVILIRSCVENSKTWRSNSLRRITGKSQHVSGIDRWGSSVQRFSVAPEMTGLA